MRFAFDPIKLKNRPIPSKPPESFPKVPDHADETAGRQYPPRLLAYILFVILLSFLDAFFTLCLLYLGAAEINPVMAFFGALVAGLPVSLVVGGFLGVFYNCLYTLFYFELVEPKQESTATAPPTSQV